MATTTTNYGFDIPQSTDLVKDGATAIATLGQDIDTAMNTALGTKKAGMVLLNTTSFSGVASASFPVGTFSATYDSYRIVFSPTAFSTAMFVSLRLRNAGTDLSSSVYHYFNQGLTTGAVANNLAAINQTSSAIGYFSGVLGNATFDLNNPFASRQKSLTGVQAGVNSGATTYAGMTVLSLIDNSSSNDSCSLLCSTGNFTGSMSVYGYNK